MRRNIHAELSALISATQRCIQEKEATSDLLLLSEEFIEKEEEAHKVITHIEHLLNKYIQGQEYFFGEVSADI